MKENAPLEKSVKLEERENNNNNNLSDRKVTFSEAPVVIKSETSHDDSSETPTVGDLQSEVPTPIGHSSNQNLPSTSSLPPPLQPPPLQKRYSFMRCLLRIGDDSTLRHIPLETGTEYWIGRLPSNNVHIDDGMLSRKHAEIKLGKAGFWTVADNKSANGTYVTPRNGVKRRLDPMTPHVLEDLDLVQFGVERPGTDDAPFRWRFHRALKFAANSNLPAQSVVDSLGNPLASSSVTGVKRPSNDDEDALDAAASSSPSSSSAAKRSRLSNGLDEQLTNYRQQLERMQLELKRKEEEKERVKLEMEAEAKSKVEEAQEQMVRLIEQEKNKFADELKGMLCPPWGKLKVRRNK